MSKTYEALIKAEKLRAAQDPAALARRVARAAEEGETLRAELRGCQEQLAALIERVDAATTIDPVVIDDLSRQVAHLAAQQQRLAAERREPLQAAIQQLEEELDRRWAASQSQSDQVAGLSRRLEEVQDRVVPVLETVRSELDELQRRGGELQSTQQTERQSFDEKLEHLNEAIARAVLSVDEQQREQHRLLQELAALRAAQEDSLRQAERSAGLSEIVESVSARLVKAEAIRRADADRLQGHVQGLQEGVDSLRIALAESDAASAAVDPAQIETLRADLDALRERLAAADNERRQLRQQLAEQHQDLSSLAATRVGQDPVEEPQPAQHDLVERLAALEDAYSSSDRRLRDVLGRLEPLLAGPAESAREIDALRAEVAALAEAHTTQRQLADEVRRMQASGEEAERRLAAIDGAQASTTETLRRQMEELRASLLHKVKSVQRIAEAAKRSRRATDKAANRQAASGDTPSPKLETLRQEIEELRASLLEKIGSVQESLAGPLQSVGEIEALRTEISALTEVQARQQQLAESVERAQANAEDAKHRITAIDEAQVSNAETLRRQMEELRRGLLEKIGSVQASLAGPLQSVGEIENLRARVGSLVDVQARQQQLADGVERAQAKAEEAARRITSIDDAQSSKGETLRRQMDELRGSLLEKIDSVQASLAGPLQSVGEIEELRTKVDAFAEVQARQQQLAERVERVRVSAQEAARRIDALDDAHASSLTPLQQQVAALQTDSATARQALGTVQSSLAEQPDLAARLETVRIQVARLLEAEARQGELADAVSRAQSAADEARRRIATNEEAQSSTLAEVRRQVDALTAESGNWRVVDVAAQSALARHEQTVGEIEELRKKLARMVEAQERQQQLFEDLFVAPASSDNHRPTAGNAEASADLASLRRQLAALQADRLKLDAFLDARFELLCEILDAELQAKVDELHGGAREGLAQKIFPEALLRGAASLAGLRKKER